MARKRGGSRRRKGNPDHNNNNNNNNNSGSDGDNDDDPNDSTSNIQPRAPEPATAAADLQPPPPKDLNFAERRQRQRQDAADKRRAKQVCHVCGLAGHVRRDCPGIADGGRGASMYPQGDVDGSRKHKKGAKNRGRKLSSGDEHIHGSTIAQLKLLEYPPGFSPPVRPDELIIRTRSEDNDNEEVDDDDRDGDKTLQPSKAFLYYDAGCDIVETIEYLQSGRGGKNKPKNEAVAEYEAAIQAASLLSVYGGCITRALLRPGRSWSDAGNEHDSDHGAGSLSWLSPRCRHRNDIWFVVGLGRDFLYNDAEQEAALSSLQDALRAGAARDSNDRATVVGVFCDLDYSPETTSRPGCDRESQLRRLRCTCQAAVETGVTIQIRCSPGPTLSQRHDNPSSTTVEQHCSSPYALVMSDLKEVLVEITANCPTVKVHLSCWSGSGDDMFALLQAFSGNLWIGFDSTVSFAKAKHAHECAFDVPLANVLLETGANTIPSAVARSLGREAFSHSGLIPFVAQALAKCKSPHLGVTAEQVARAASANTRLLYPRIVTAVPNTQS